MPSRTLTFTAVTDARGAYARDEVFNPPGPFPLTVTITVRLLAPAGVTVVGTLDIDAVDGHPSNDARQFTLSTQPVELGKWKLDGGDNRIVVSGQTIPALPHTSVEIEVLAQL